MNARAQTIKQLINDDLYAIDDDAVAAAILLRMRARRALPEVTFRSAPGRPAPVRSFRPHRGARSFRLSPAARRSPHPRSVGLALARQGGLAG